MIKYYFYHIHIVVFNHTSIIYFIIYRTFKYFFLIYMFDIYICIIYIYVHLLTSYMCHYKYYFSYYSHQYNIFLHVCFSYPNTTIYIPLILLKNHYNIYQMFISNVYLTIITKIYRLYLYQFIMYQYPNSF